MKTQEEIAEHFTDEMLKEMKRILPYIIIGYLVNEGLKNETDLR